VGFATHRWFGHTTAAAGMIGRWQRRRDAGKRDDQRGDAVGMRMARVVQANGRIVHRCARAALAACFLLAATGSAQAQVRDERNTQTRKSPQPKTWALKEGKFLRWCGENYVTQIGRLLVIYSPQGRKLAEFRRALQTLFEGCDDSGERIYFIDDDKGEIVYIELATRTTELMLRYRPGTAPPFIFISPDRKHVAFIRASMVPVVDQTTRINLIPIDRGRAVWSPDSRRYATFEETSFKEPGGSKVRIKVYGVETGFVTESALPANESYRSAFFDGGSNKIWVRVALDDISGDGKIYRCDVVTGKCNSDGKNYEGLSMSRFGDMVSVQKIFKNMTFSPKSHAALIPEKYVVKAISRHKKISWTSTYAPPRHYLVGAQLSPSGKFLAIRWLNESSRCAGWIDDGRCFEGIVIDMDDGAADGKHP
jgi:hypothetical protein